MTLFSKTQSFSVLPEGLEPSTYGLRDRKYQHEYIAFPSVLMVFRAFLYPPIPSFTLPVDVSVDVNTVRFLYVRRGSVGTESFLFDKSTKIVSRMLSARNGCSFLGLFY